MEWHGEPAMSDNETADEAADETTQETAHETTEETAQQTAHETAQQQSQAPLADEPSGVRAEDAFDVERVHAWLGREGGSGSAEVRQFRGGASNLTYLLRYPDRDLILRRAPAGTKAKSAHDMRREYTIQERLRPVFPYVPAMVGLCTDERVIGGDFYVMERVPGLILRQEPPAGLALPPDRVRALSHVVLDRLVDLHAVDPAAAGLTDLGKGPGYVRRQVTGWSDRYRKALTPDVPGFEEVMAWLDRWQPPDVASCVIHNDFRFDNVVLDPDPAAWDRPTAVRGILDWELATIGDPLMDLGGALAYWVQADDAGEFGLTRRQPTHLPGMPTRAEVVAYYCRRTGRSADNWPFYEVFGLFRLAVIAQQIHYRYYHGQTTNPAFQHFGLAVGWLQDQARKVMA